MSKNRNLLNLKAIFISLLAIEINSINLFSKNNSEYISNNIFRNCSSKCNFLNEQNYCQKNKNYFNISFCLENCMQNLNFLNICCCENNERKKFRWFFDKNGFIKKISICDYKCFFLSNQNLEKKKNNTMKNNTEGFNFGIKNNVFINYQKKTFFEDDKASKKNRFYYKSENELED